MTQEQWSAMTPAQKDAARSLDSLTPQLVGLEGWRVEVTEEWGEVSRGIVGRSTGWVPIHILLKTRASSGGYGASRTYKAVRRLYRVR